MNFGYGNKHVWIVEASSFPFKKWNPIITFGGGKVTTYLATGMHLNRKSARLAAKFMIENNSYNHPRFPKTVKYRVSRYLRQTN